MVLNRNPLTKEKLNIGTVIGRRMVFERRKAVEQ